ncbi:hypothetical protein GO988_13520 [Hymenobacter sp. HMF4947]|uniref:Uncharacterized protein n=1 Tax=Hymenobacter ginkgonis TaxID=2682976 RepID=A0A7K1TG25_9BACT|nr:hypothetical protein [Hymenobacter ginkgonis]MVN77349.1 hypothetical protein [Hymenobacter ginkgonis]
MPTQATTAPAAIAPSPHRRWGRWLLVGLGLLVVGFALAIWLGLDPWLRRTLEKQVAQKTHGQYQLTISRLKTNLWARTLHLRGVALHPTPRPLADTLPRVQLRLARLDLSGVGLLALLRRQTVPVDSLTLDSLQVAVLALARRPAPHPTPPFYQQLPVRLGYLALRHAGGSWGPAAAPVAQLPSAEVVAHEVLFTSAGATDTQRLAFAAAWQVLLRYPRGQVGGHTLALAKARFSTQRKSLVLDSVSIEPPAPRQGKPGATQVALLLPHLRFTRLRAATWQHQHRFRADSLVVQQPRLAFRPPVVAPPPLWQLIAPLARRADISHLLINDAFMAITGLRHQPVARHIYAAGHAIRVDSLGGQADQGRVLYARNWTARSGRLTAVFQAPAYPASIERVALDTKAGTLRLTGLALRPVFSPAQLNQRSGHQTTQLRVYMTELRAQGLDFGLLSDHSHVRIARLTAESPWIGLSSDGRGPLGKRPSVITPEAMRKLHLHMEVGRLDLRNGTIATRYRGIETPRVGTLNINRLNATLRNVSNNPRHQTMTHPLTGSATAYVQGRSYLQVHLTAPLLDPEGRHHLWGSFGASPLSILNPMVTPTKLLAFKSGEVQRIAFDMQASRRGVAGTMWASYTDLKIEFFKYKEGELKKPLFTRLTNGLLNGLVIRDNNPRPSGRFVTGDMRTRREPRNSVFSAWRQGLISGGLHSVGVPQKMAQKLSQSQKTVPLP